MGAIVVHKPRSARWAGLVFGSVAIGVALAWWVHADDIAGAPRALASAPVADAAPVSPAPVVRGTTATSAVFQTGVEALPASLRGTEVSGELEEDAQGNLKLTRGVRNVFDYFLSATGEEPAAQQRARVAAFAARHVGPRAAAQVLALFDRYVAYKDDLDARLRDTRPVSLEDMRARVVSVRAARDRHFDPAVVKAFFGDEDTYDTYSLGRLAIMKDTSLSPQEKARRVAALRAGLPESMRSEQDVVEVVETLGTLTEDLKQRSGTASDLRQLRETLVGSEAAERLETLDRQTEAWNHRVADYLRQRAVLLGDVSLADSTRRERVDALRSEAFSATERLRIETIERIQDSGARDATSASRLSVPG
ncbi:lipase secretion chaperone [Piscinibacter gummiphilus]|uniref:Lipase chaperone n=1 Tax=Piscinibacter gummiphilus TaxID=946333 RepID=A0A1W6LEU7_9BURK|nr:lipase secretion chaperone [Piscinibacter gummiphilus]ARN22698.1 hypothetical protein A4W93_23855 [Piscinibacter gummiphilus]ATU67395.1 lipase chaperone [Piscinibacter gummiphilus]GLS97751.1 lipase chaperone [Piscinibacter gummiphilus]